MKSLKNTPSPWMLSSCGLFVVAMALVLSSFTHSSAEAKQPKASICHQTGNGSFHTITVATPAVAAHLAHGDVAVGGTCSVGVGACTATGLMTCTPGGAACNAVAGTPSAEVCGNTIDDDCDGSVDEGCFVCTPTLEICDNIDNDCDGTVDEGNVCQPACLTHADCNDGNSCTNDTCAAGTCQNTAAPAGMACDDGLFCTTSDSCNGAGQCAAGPARVCSAAACQTGVCDEAANVCTTQNAPNGTPSGQTCGTGACMNFGICQNGVGQTCVPGPASTETCDNIDNNCNGTVDEGC